MDWSLPNSLTAWAEFAANVVTALGIFAIAITFRASVRVQARLALLREIEALRNEPGVPFTKETADVFNTVLHWARSSPFAGGPQAEGFGKLNDTRMKNYRAWVAHVVALFDLALMDDGVRADPKTRPAILAFLARHAAALQFWPRFGVVRLSPRMRGLVGETLAGFRP